jgi:hypothetical protein
MPDNRPVTKQDLDAALQALTEALTAHIDELFRAYRVEVAIANAPPDDEPYTPEQQAADAEAFAAFERGEGIPHEQILRDLGLVP